MALRTRLRAVVLTPVFVFALAAPAVAAPAWLTATPLSATGQNAIDLAVAATPNGRIVATWSRFDSAAGNFRIEAVVRPAGGPFSPVAKLSDGANSATLDQLAADANNNVVAVWRRNDGTNERIEYADLPAGATAFTAGTRITPDAGTSFESNPDVAVDAAGDTFVAFRKSDGASNLATVATRLIGGAFAIQTLSAAGQTIFDPNVSSGPNGNAVAVWQRFDGTHDRIQASFRDPGGTFSQGVNISDSTVDSSKPQVAVDPSGNAIAVWQQSNRIEAAYRPAGGSFGTPVPISAAGQNAGEPQVAMDTQGDATAVWDRSDGTNTIVQAATRPAGSGSVFPSAASLSAAGQNAQVPELTVDAAGDVIVVWKRSDGTKVRIQQAVRALGGAFTPATEISAAGQNADFPFVAADPQGNAAAVFTRSDGASNIATVAGYDGAGPILSGLTIPATGTAGTASNFSVAPVDVWSALASTNWTFGDGSADGSGNAVSHTYAAEGSYSAKVTVSDALGNATTSAATPVAISPAPVQQNQNTQTQTGTTTTPTMTTPVTTPTNTPAKPCAVKKTGTAKADKLVGSALGDLIRGGKGNDR